MDRRDSSANRADGTENLHLVDGPRINIEQSMSMRGALRSTCQTIEPEASMPTPAAAPDRGHRPLGISRPDFGRRTPERLNRDICSAAGECPLLWATAGISPLMASEAASSILGMEPSGAFENPTISQFSFHAARRVALIKNQIAEFSHRRVSVMPPESQTLEERSTTQGRGGS